MNVSVVTNPRGMNTQQIETVKNTLSSYDKLDTVIIHGGDRQDELIHSLAKSLGFKIEIYPQVSSQFNYEDAQIHNELPFAERNRKLVEHCDKLIAIPMIIFEEEDSPLWKTVRFAVKQDINVIVISPRGHIWEH